MTRPAILILASASVYRRRLLERLGIEFQVHPADIDESSRPGEAPERLAARLAREKASAVAARHPDALVLGADQVAESNGRILSKPGGRDEALRQLAAMCGAPAVWHSAIALIGPDGIREAVIPTRARLRRFTTAEAERYVDIDRPFDCAGSMRSESLGSSLLESLTSDDPSALIGLPLIRVSEWLRAAGFSVP